MRYWISFASRALGSAIRIVSWSRVVVRGRTRYVVRDLRAGFSWLGPARLARCYRGARLPKQVKAMFVIYVAVIVAGIAYFTVIGLTHN